MDSPSGVFILIVSLDEIRAVLDLDVAYKNERSLRDLSLFAVSVAQLNVRGVGTRQSGVFRIRRLNALFARRLRSCVVGQANFSEGEILAISFSQLVA